MTDWYIFPVIGAIGGFVAGLLGIGGGVIFTPVLMLFLQPLEAIATSLAAMTFSTTISTWLHVRQKAIDFSRYRKMLPGILIGSLLGAYLAKDTPADILRALFGFFSLFISVFFLLNIRTETEHPPSLNSVLELCSFGFATSLIASFLGIGGGVIAMVLFLSMGYSMKTILGVTSILSMTITYIAALPLIQEVNLQALITIAPTSALFAYLGVKTALKLHTKYLEKFFGCFLLLMGSLLLKPFILTFFEI